jgi:hypothetical protein
MDGLRQQTRSTTVKWHYTLVWHYYPKGVGPLFGRASGLVKQPPHRQVGKPSNTPQDTHYKPPVCDLDHIGYVTYVTPP